MYSADSYRTLLQLMQSHSIEFSTDWHARPHQDFLLLRHDVDFSVQSAHTIASIEESLNVTSTFFFMLSSNMYNVLSKRNRTLVQEISDMNHKISLHFDPTAYDSLEAFMFERSTFENCFGVTVDITSIHRPGPFIEKNNTELLGSKQTYQDTYFKEMTYISDSGGRDITSTVKDYLDSDERTGLHLLIHPIWWGETFDSPTDTLLSWKEAHCSFLHQEIQANCKTFNG